MTMTQDQTGTELAAKKCQECEKGTPPLDRETVQRNLTQLPHWSLEDGKLVRNLKVKNFQAALDLVNAVGKLAEAEGHHPDLLIHSWNQVKITFYTHSIGGLSQNDFIMAAKTDRLEGLPTD